ncbi:MAG: efflux RND transporter periplasmic adaptor subunit, partial [Acidobacteriaceae bacterium]|nr:efflux RND transporter periplasmic adaptor subunit [Acidobacteriaceae bacterium]
ASCTRKDAPAQQKTAPSAPETVGVAVIKNQPLETTLTLSSELVPFQEIDIYAKESGYIKQLLVDYGTHVRRGQLMAVLEIPELQALLDQDQAEIGAARDQVTRAEHDVTTADAQHKVSRLIFERLNGVAQSKPGLVAQQEVDDAQAKDLATEGQLEAAKAALAAAQSQLGMAKAKLAHDQALFSYSRITAPFDGVVTQRYANLGALMQAGTSSTQAMPLVRLSQENLFRLVIPVPESDVRYVRTGQAVEVRVPSLGRRFTGHVARISVDIAESTRTMHTEVDVPNENNALMPGLYAEAVLQLQRNGDALAVPLQAVDREGARTTVMLVDSQDRLETRELTIGIQTSDYAEVLSGLREGERVVVSDRSGLKPGQAVNPEAIQVMSYAGKGAESSAK